MAQQRRTRCPLSHPPLRALEREHPLYPDYRRHRRDLKRQGLRPEPFAIYLDRVEVRA
jgi:hypothetical protein